MSSSDSPRLLTSSGSSYINPLSKALETDISPCLQLQQLLEDESVPSATVTGPGYDKLSKLGRMLSIKSMVKTTSEFAARQEAIQTRVEEHDPTTSIFFKIGAGTCGTVFSELQAGLAFKMANHNGTNALTGDLFNDFKMHAEVLHAMQSVSHRIDFALVPQLHAYIPESNKAWWQSNEALSAAASANGLQTPCRVLCSERITPLPDVVRTLLIDAFCPEGLRSQAHHDRSNEDCLVRVYLGASRQHNPRSRFFSLRNYKLHLNQMIQLGMDVNSYVRAMAGTLATMHWKARIDAKDIEFVIGSAPGSTVPRLSRSKVNFGHVDEDTYVRTNSDVCSDWHERTVNLWVLDFNLCSTISMDDAGVAMAATAWKVNDPYYPKPLQDGAVGRELWNVFVCRYIEMSDRILRSRPELAVLPRKFIASIVQIQRERKGKAVLV